MYYRTFPPQLFDVVVLVSKTILPLATYKIKTKVRRSIIFDHRLKP